jgi:hypothetical protein
MGWPPRASIERTDISGMRSARSILARGGSHRSLTDTGWGYNLGGADLPHYTPRPSQPMVLRFPPNGPVRSQVIQS